jgi:hypothetical protein
MGGHMAYMGFKKKCMQGFDGDDLKRELLEKLCIGGRIILKLIIIKQPTKYTISDIYKHLKYKYMDYIIILHN